MSHGTPPGEFCGYFLWRADDQSGFERLHPANAMRSPKRRFGESVLTFASTLLWKLLRSPFLDSSGWLTIRQLLGRVAKQVVFIQDSIGLDQVRARRAQIRRVVPHAFH